MKIKENIAVSENGFIFDSGTGESYSVSPSGADILQWIKEFKDENIVMQKMIEKYEADEITIEKDLNDFISVLKQYNFIVTENTDNQY